MTAGVKVSPQSGADTILKGAVVTAPQVQDQVGGNLQIENLQDYASYTGRQKTPVAPLSMNHFSSKENE